MTSERVFEDIERLIVEDPNPAPTLQLWEFRHPMLVRDWVERIRQWERNGGRDRPAFFLVEE